MADLGKVAVRARGEWVIGVAYETLDMVTHNLNLYIALKDTAIEPTDDGVNWQLLMEGVPIATASKAGKSKPDGKTITIDPDGTLHGASQVPEGVTYVDLQSSDSEQLPDRIPVDADTLDGNPPEYFATKQEVLDLDLTQWNYQVPNGDKLLFKSASGEKDIYISNSEYDYFYIGFDDNAFWRMGPERNNIIIAIDEIHEGKQIFNQNVKISESLQIPNGKSIFFTDNDENVNGFILTRDPVNGQLRLVFQNSEGTTSVFHSSDLSVSFDGELFADNGLTAKGASLFNGTVTHTGFTHLRNTAIPYNHGFYFGNSENKDSYLFFTGTDKKLYLNYYATDGSGYTIITFSNNYPSFNAGLTVEPTAAPNFTGKCGIQFTNIYHGDNVHKIVQNTNNLVFCNSKTPFSGFVESAHVDINGNWVFKKNITAPNIASTTAELLTAQQDITEADLQNIELQQRVAQLEEKVQVLTGGASLGRTEY